MRFVSLLTALFIFSICFTHSSCTKNPPQPVTPVDTLPRDTVPPIDTFSVVNQWQCTIDGTTYSGKIDTSFRQMFFPYQGADTLVIATGTSADKKIHIHFKAAMNRQGNPGSGIDYSNSYLVFDTAAYNLYIGRGYSQFGSLKYVVDTFINDNAVISFSGVLLDNENASHQVTGAFSCKMNTGDNDPNKFFCWADSNKKAGYFISSKMNANTLVLEGINYSDLYPLEQFQLAIKTGGTIRPGTYKSSDGNVGFICYGGNFHPYYYVDDSLGNMTASIESVDGNIIHGSFSGTDNTLGKITAGSFTCKVDDYIPEAISENRWSMNMLGNVPFNELYQLFAGNITKAVKTNNNGRNYLTIQGQSDNDASVFKIVISSELPLTKGQYKLSEYNANQVDSLYFISGMPTWDNKLVKYIADSETSRFGGDVYVFIDEVDDKHVTGWFYGDMYSNDYGSVFGGYLHKGTFNTSF